MHVIVVIINDTENNKSGDIIEILPSTRFFGKMVESKISNFYLLRITDAAISENEHLKYSSKYINPSIIESKSPVNFGKTITQKVLSANLLERT